MAEIKEQIVERLREAIKLAESMGVRGKHPSNIYNLTSEAADRIEALEKDNERLRLVVSSCAASLPNGAFVSPSASIEFMEKLPHEIASVYARLALNATPQDGKGGEES